MLFKVVDLPRQENWPVKIIAFAFLSLLRVPVRGAHEMRSIVEWEYTMGNRFGLYIHINSTRQI